MSSCIPPGSESTPAAESVNDGPTPRRDLKELKATSTCPLQARKIKHAIFVVSGKGGVGKSAVAVNLAVSLAASGARTGILDVDIHGPSVPTLLGMEERLQPKDSETLSPAYYDNTLAVVSMDSLLENRNDAIIWRGPKKTAVIRQLVAGVDWGTLDYLVIDSPPGTGDEHLAVLNALPAAHCLMVTTPQAVALADMRKAVSFLHKVNASILGLVENMSGLSCPHCGGHINLFTEGGGETLASEEGIPFLGKIPIDPLVVAAAQAGKPVSSLPADSPAKTAFAELAARVMAELP